MHSPIRIPPSGPIRARVLIVGEYATADDEWKMAPFSGGVGNELTKMLHEAGILQSECRMTLVLPYRPAKGQLALHFNKVKKAAADFGLSHFANEYYYDDSIAEGVQQLYMEVAAIQPTVIIALGELALWALTGNTGLTSWRGSLLDFVDTLGPVVIPTYHPSAIMRSWDWRAIAVRDLQRASAYLEDPAAYAVPDYRFIIRPSIDEALWILAELKALCDLRPTKISCDIETIARNISCIGLGWSATHAICIPMLGKGGVDYYSLDEETAIYAALKELLTHPNCLVVGQNFSYDRQHFAKSLGYQPNLQFDTMIAQHLLYPGMPKALDFIASMYCHYYRYWKDELKDFNKMPDDIHEYWTYNCKDCVITWEVSNVLESLIEKAGMIDQYFFQMRMLEHLNTTMLRGVRIDSRRRSEVAGQLMEAIAIREQLIHDLVGFPLNVGSPKQMATFLYEDLKLPPVLNRKTKRPTCDDDALKTIAHKNPILKPLLDVIAEKRSLGVFLSTFCMMPLDTDGRMRTSYNLAGTETFRLNSSENAFGSGGNLQNIPKGEEE
jgi:uracil-DNA glycosylase